MNILSTAQALDIKGLSEENTREISNLNAKTVVMSSQNREAIQKKRQRTMQSVPVPDPEPVKSVHIKEEITAVTVVDDDEEENDSAVEFNGSHEREIYERNFQSAEYFDPMENINGQNDTVSVFYSFYLILSIHNFHYCPNFC